MGYKCLRGTTGYQRVPTGSAWYPEKGAENEERPCGSSAKELGELKLEERRESDDLKAAYFEVSEI